jgi:hypothetical protein
MGGPWVRDCKTILDQIKKLESVEGRDRLDVVRTIRFTLYAIHRSVSGWVEWANNPDIMANFSLDELKEISMNLAKLTQPFIEYDCEITSRAQKDLTIPELETRTESTERTTDRSDTFYIK